MLILQTYSQGKTCGLAKFMNADQDWCESRACGRVEGDRKNTAPLCEQMFACLKLDFIHEFTGGGSRKSTEEYRDSPIFKISLP